MTQQIAFTLTILVAAIALLVSERWSADVVSLLVMLILMLANLLTPAEALASFANPVVITISSIFVVSAALFQTGVATKLGRGIVRLAGDSEPRLIAALMLGTALLSGAMNNLGVTAVLMPAVYVLPGSPLVGQTLAESSLGRDYGLTVLGIVRQSHCHMAPSPMERICAGDRLLTEGGPRRFQRAADKGIIWDRATVDETELLVGDVGVAEVTLTPRSAMAGKTLRELDFRERKRGTLSSGGWFFSSPACWPSAWLWKRLAQPNGLR